MSNLDYLKQAFNNVGWFIPPYVQLGYLERVAHQIDEGEICERTLASHLAQIYSPGNLAAMVSERYNSVPYVNEYCETIAECVEAHFLGLNHIAVSGLMPVIEGAGRKLADSRSVQVTSIKSVFQNLAADCKIDVIDNNIGAVGEIVSMMDAFIEFTDNNLYINSNSYPLSDNTNRHGILHGAFSDADYGEPLNFFKSIGAIDFLCFVSALRAPISCFAPSPSEASNKLAAYYWLCVQLGKRKPTAANKAKKISSHPL
ncbi:hypothetical protein L2728_09700 [Shewanella chilikensis]|uniref:hypothetical protein n=1 Tax=Shewanella chilikensis TaxID=558541 RepID=UPI00200DADBB|nr:hypothetical protein [Shewanella chilikensis]MCL1162143.1 hypothetical protein [Shewanella chilikensis]